jgi:DNA integrity scanning protein DisA with diadenylate cyclase activity
LTGIKKLILSRDLLTVKLMTKTSDQNIITSVCKGRKGFNLTTLESMIFLAVEIAREGREGRKIGTMFIVSDSKRVMRRSKCLILDPLGLHPVEARHIDNPDLRETVKELSQLDGAFIVSDDGIVLSACRYVNATSRGLKLPLGLGSRHVAAASITKQTKSLAIVVSESSVVRIFDGGEIVTEILPELWLLNRYGIHINAPFTTQKTESITVACINE